MTRPRLEVAEVLRRYHHEYLATHSISPGQRQVVADLVACRSAALGGHLQRCGQCGHEEIAYNSCRNRHCPKCQGKKQADWLQAQCANLLDVPYYHIVFTLPQQLSPLALQNKRLLYGLLLRCASQTLLTIARDEKHLGAGIGFTAILHTWGQTLLHHPHVHCVVPAGGLSEDHGRWVPAREQFFLPVRVLSRFFRSKYLFALRQAWRNDELLLSGRLQGLANPRRWGAFLKALQQIDWVVYAKPPFGSTGQVLKYLARYTHRVAIANRRLLSLEGGQVAFRYKDYRHGRRNRIMRLTAIEFIRRFLLHLLPKGFVRIRHYGFLANRDRQNKLALCRRLVSTPGSGQDRTAQGSTASSATPTICKNPHSCPVCELGTMLRVAIVPPARAGPEPYSDTLHYA